MIQIWVVTPYGKNASHYTYKTKDRAFNAIWSYDLANRTVAIGSSLIGNPKNKEIKELQRLVIEADISPRPKSAKIKAEQLWDYYNKVKKGDFIIAKTGLNEVLGIGKVFKKDGNVAFYSIEKGIERCGNNSNQHPNFLNVEWMDEKMNFGNVNVFRRGRFGLFEKMVVKEHLEIYGKRILKRISDLWGIDGKYILAIRNGDKLSNKKNGRQKNMFNKNLLDKIQLLRQDPVHSEREHESLVENFYQSLGWQPTSDIKYRRGRIDISIQKNNKVLIVNEVKTGLGAE